MIQPVVMPVICRSLCNTLRPLTQTWKRKVRDGYAGPTRLTLESKRMLAEAIFAVEMEHEPTVGAAAKQVKLLREIRNVLLDDIGENENLPVSKYSGVESVAKMIAEKRREGNTAAFTRRASEAL
jgi:hypothetical protein